MINDRKAGRRIHLYRPGAIGPEGVEALESEQDEVLIEVLEDRPFGDVIGTVPHTALHPEWYNQSQMILEDINMITGVSEYARGVMPDIKRTATEAGLIQDAANARSADKQWKVEQMMARVAKSMIRLTQMYMEGSQVAKVVDDNMVQHWIEFTSQDLMGDFTFKVEAGSTQPQNETFRRQSALQLMDVMSPMIGSGMINDQKLIEHVLRNGFGIKNATDFLGPGPQPPPPEPGMEGMPPEQMPPGMPPGMPPEMMGAM